jgi:eukaryotic-like serine/threonine-protein kinase
MTPELWQRLRPLYDAALDITPDRRDHYVADVCGSDIELKEALQALLSASDDTDDTLDEPLISFNGHGLGKGRSFSPEDLILGRYRIVRLLGVGGMGEVYEAEDLRLQGVHVALKTILPHIASDPELQKRFEHEVLLAREVSHPNLCPIYSIDRCDDPMPDLLFLTMKLLPGRTLAARLREKPPVSSEEGMAVLRQMALGLSAIHTAGIIHRDIKPNNIMLDGVGPNPRLWITDFGLARAFETETTLSGKGTVAGTPGYIAPELYLGHSPSVASDLFAFGVVLHEVFAGRRPTPSADNSSVTVSPKLSSPRVPQFCVELVTECLHTDPKRRCKAFERALETIDESRTRGRSTGQFWTRRRFVGAAAAGVCAAAGGAWWKWDDLENWRHPLPKRRFVALLNWPRTSDGKVVPMLTGVLGAIKSELSRIEAFDRDFFIISPEDVPQDLRSAAHLKEICDPLGANLVLAASGLPQPKAFQLFLRVLDTSGRSLREKTIKSTPDGVTSLPGQAAHAAASLLSLNHYLPASFQAAPPETQSAAAFNAFQSAEALMKQPDTGLDAAIEKYKQAVELDPSYAIAHARLAMAYCEFYVVHHETGALDLARGNAEHALTLNPALVDGYLARASVLEETGDEQDALDQVAKALALDPHNPRTQLWQANIYSRLNRWSDAERSYHRVLDARPNSWVTYNELGFVLHNQAKYLAAVQAFRDASIAAPRSAMALSNLGEEYLQIGEFAKATEALKRSLSVDPNFDPAAANASLALRYQGKAQEALPYALKSVELNQANDQNWLELGDCYSSLPNRNSEAKRAYMRAAQEAQKQLQTDPTNGPTWMLLALYQVKSGELRNAPSLMVKAESLGAIDVDSQVYKARILEILGKRAEALATLAACFHRGASGFQLVPFPDMKALQKDPRYLELVRSQTSPSGTNPPSRVGNT